MLREAVHSQAILLLFSFCFALEPDGVSSSPVSSAGSRGSAVAMVCLWISDVLYLVFRLAFPGMASWATELAFLRGGAQNAEAPCQTQVWVYPVALEAHAGEVKKQDLAFCCC